jgi:hypothetical protein
VAANVSNATVRCLSNISLAQMPENRHQVTMVVRDEVTEKSSEWWYKLGSVYVRKIHFHDAGMIRQIEEKVVNRLRQVTAAIKQDGANQVSITNTAMENFLILFSIARILPAKAAQRDGRVFMHQAISTIPNHKFISSASSSRSFLDSISCFPTLA